MEESIMEKQFEQVVVRISDWNINIWWAQDHKSLVDDALVEHWFSANTAYFLRDKSWYTPEMAQWIAEQINSLPPRKKEPEEDYDPLEDQRWIEPTSDWQRADDEFGGYYDDAEAAGFW